VESVHRGNDGIIRSADIRTSNGRTNRPISKLYPLEVRTAHIPSADPPAAIVTHDERLRPRREAAQTAIRNIRKMFTDSHSDDEL
jgi:hypothetical protein